MFELSSTYWYVTWGVMFAAFICAWFFIVLGCRVIDAGGETTSEEP